MLFYFYAHPDAPASHDSQLILKTLSKLLHPEHFLLSNLVPASLNTIASELPPSSSISDSISAFIIHNSAPPLEAALILSFAALRKKPILILVQKYSSIAPTFDTFFKQAKPDSSVFSLKFYQPTSLEKILSHFFTSASSPQLQPPTIKFTLRFSPNLHQSLSKLSKQLKKSLAGLVRDVLADFLREQEKVKEERKKPLEIK